MSETQRNFLILGVIVLIAALLGGSDTSGANIVTELLSLAFLVLTVWALVVFYTRRQGTIGLMPTQPRLIFQTCYFVGMGAAILGLFPIGLLFRLGITLPSPFGFSYFGGSYTMLFWGLIIGCAIACYLTYDANKNW